MTYYDQPKNETIVEFPNLWKQRTLLEKVLIILYLIIGTTILIAVVIFYLIFSHDKSGGAGTFFRKGSMETQLCLTPGCIHTASSILNRMDSDVQPCDDFYEFACGKFIRDITVTIPDEKLTVDTFSTVADEIEIQLKTIINEPIRANESRAFILAKRLNASCMNRTAVEALGLRPMKEILDSYGGWPVTKGDEWDEKSWDWIETIGKMRRTGLTSGYVLSTSIGANFKNSTMHTLRIDQPDLGLTRSFLLNDNEKTTQLYYDFMVDMAVIFGANYSAAKKEMLDALNFEKMLANISTPAEERRDGEAQYNPHTIHDIQVKYPYIRWLEYLNGIMPKDMPLTENEVVVVITPVFFERLGAVLRATSKRTISNYLMWRSILIASTFLNTEVRYRKLTYLASQSNQKELEVSSALWKECIGYTASTLSVSVGALYVRHYFDNNVRDRAVKMVEDIRGAFIEMLHAVPWMDDETKQKAISKAQALTTHIGYPDELTNDTLIEELYKDLEITQDEYLMNAIRLNHFKTDFAFRQLHNPINKTHWLSHASPAVINAFYSAIENSIQFPAGILQGQFLSASRPEFANYGAIGQIIGHEITHGFDDQGRQFDEHGNLVDWWKTQTKDQFLNRSKCIIDQYSNFTDSVLNMTLNGVTTQGENVADNGGVKCAYNAYQKWARQHGNEKRLPGLNYTPNQLFWISAAQTWCSVSRDWYTKVVITTDSHAVNKYRVIGSLHNNHEFANDFQCKPGTPMNPVHKCRIW